MKNVSKVQIGTETYQIKDAVARLIGEDVTGLQTIVDGIVNDVELLNTKIDNVEGGLGVTGTYDEGTETLTLS